VRDVEIRGSLRARLDSAHGGDPDTLIRNELGLCLGESRVDLAVINGKITGYEIKSERDTLDRLDGQVAVYNRVLDEAWLVMSQRHVNRALGRIPPWWGVLAASSDSGSIGLEVLQEASPNPKVVPYAVAQLLWRDEAFDVLRNRGLQAGFASATRFRLWEELAEKVPLDELRHEVCSRLRARQEWSGG
jgi:hypothetical protein